MVLNSTSGNVYPIEETARDICRFTKNLTTALCIYDMCKDELVRYPELSKRAAKIKKQETKKPSAHGRGIGEETDLGVPYWAIAGAESLGVVDAYSVLCPEIVTRMQEMGSQQGMLEFP